MMQYANVSSNMTVWCAIIILLKVACAIPFGRSRLSLCPELRRHTKFWKSVILGKTLNSGVYSQMYEMTPLSDTIIISWCFSLTSQWCKHLRALGFHMKLGSDSKAISLFSHPGRPLVWLPSTENCIFSWCDFKFWLHLRCPSVSCNFLCYHLTLLWLPFVVKGR
jgi:hypothetical protein